MAYVKKTWKPRISQYPGRRRMVGTGEANTYDITRAEGTVTQTGDAFSADNMNDLETRIGNEFTAINNNLAAGYVSKNIAAGATVEQAVSFSTSRQNTQYAVTLDQCSDGGTYTGITLSVKSKTADGFVIRIASSRSDTITLGVNWICIPYSA